MPITLFAHNQQVYAQAAAMMAKTGKTAVIHPTGTGKSFIGFKLCEDPPSQRICWLSPSEYIFKTQLENLKDASDGFTPENITTSFWMSSTATVPRCGVPVFRPAGEVPRSTPFGFDGYEYPASG